MMEPVNRALLVPIAHSSIESSELKEFLQKIYQDRVLELQPVCKESKSRSFKVMDHSLAPRPEQILLLLRDFDDYNERNRLYCKIEHADLMQLGPKLIDASERKGYILTEHLQPACQPIDLIDLADTLRGMHQLKLPYFIDPDAESKTFNLFHRQMIGFYKKMVIPDCFSQLFKSVNKIKRLLDTLKIERKFCHLNLHKGNILIDNGFIKFTGWEFSGLDDPLVELAGAAIMLGLKPEEERTFVNHYFYNNMTEDVRMHYLIVRPLPYLVKIAWGLRQAMAFDSVNTLDLCDKLWGVQDFLPFSKYLDKLTPEGYSEELTSAEDWIRFTLSALKSFYDICV